MLLMQQEAEALPKFSVLNTLQNWPEKQIPDNKLNIFYWEWYGASLHWQWLKILRDWSETCWENPDFENIHLSARCLLWQQRWGRKTTVITKLIICFQTLKCKLKWCITVYDFDSSLTQLLFLLLLDYHTINTYMWRKAYFNLLCTSTPNKLDAYICILKELQSFWACVMQKLFLLKLLWSKS